MEDDILDFFKYREENRKKQEAIQKAAIEHAKRTAAKKNEGSIKTQPQKNKTVQKKSVGVTNSQPKHRQPAKPVNKNPGKVVSRAKQKAIEKMNKMVLRAAIVFAAGVVVGSSLTSNYYSSQMNNSNDNIGIESIAGVVDGDNGIKAEDYDKFYMGYYGDVQYKFIDERYALELAQNAIDKVNATLADLKPIREGSDKFLPDSIDKYLLTGLACQESSFRVCKKNGEVLTSIVGAQGLCQVRSELALVDVNNWLNAVEAGFQYKAEDLGDPQINMEVSMFYQAMMLHKYFRDEYGKNQVYALLSAYNIGPTKINKLESSELRKKYIEDDTSYANKVMRYAEKFRDRYPSNESDSMSK